MNRMQAWSGQFATAKHEGLVSPDYSVFVPSRDANVDFYQYLLRTPILVAQFAQASRGIGTGFNRLYGDDFGAIHVPCPPLDEQAAIVKYLAHVDRKIDRFIRSKRRMIELLNEQKQAIIHQAVTKGLDPSVPMKDSGVEGLGEIPAHWEVRRMGTLGSIRYGLGQPPRLQDDGLPMIRATNVQRGSITRANMLYVAAEDVPKSRNAFLRSGEIVVVRSGAYTADSAIVPDEYEGAVAGYDMVLTPTSAYPKFVAWVLLSTYVLRDQLITASSRSAQPHLNAGELASCLVFVPPVEEQEGIADYLDRSCAEIDSGIAQIRAELGLIREYRTRLIGDVVTGKVDIRMISAKLNDDDLAESTSDDMVDEVQTANLYDDGET